MRLPSRSPCAASRRSPVAALVLAGLALAACEAPPAALVDAGVDAARVGRDAGPPFDAGRVEARDGGPFEIDAGACEEWGPGEGEPIEGLAAGAWTFVPFDEARCMNGTSTGIGVNLSPSGTRRLLIYLEGGGACFNSSTCSGVAGQRGFDAASLASLAIVLDGYGIFRRDDESNPARDWSFVYVPYCTGDAHAGTNPDGFEGRQQVGHSNIAAYLRRLVPTFPDLEKVLLTGASAGGLGAFSNFDQVQHAFGCTPVYALDDSGPILGDDYLRPCLQATTRELWGLAIPEDCPQCAFEDGGGLVALWPYLAKKYPDRRIGLLSTVGDGVIRSFYGYGFSESCDSGAQMTSGHFLEGLLDLRENILAPHPNTATFYVPGSAHTFLIGGLGRPLVGELTLGEWIRRMIEDDPSWDHVGP
jgi:hypothetical protein